MLQNGQTEPKRKLWVIRSRIGIRRETKFVRSKKASKTGKIELNEIFQPNKGVL